MTSPSPIDPGPFYFKWVDEDETTFDPDTMLAVDEDIFDFALKHDEGQFAVLDITVRNPRVGLLNSDRQLWAWFSYRKADGVTIKPLFFGVLTGIPSDMFAELVQLKFDARPHDFIPRKQTVAEGLKIRPFYDPVGLDDVHRDDPDAILEGWSKLYHIDRLTHTVTVSDILEGEDGTITFDQTQGIYESVRVELGEAPLDVVQIQAAVQWTQRCTGLIEGPPVNVLSYTGSSFKGDWPRPGGSIGGGWTCEASYVTDNFGTDHAKSISYGQTINISEGSNPLFPSQDCSVTTQSVSYTTCSVPGLAIDQQVESTAGHCDPFADTAQTIDSVEQAADGSEVHIPVGVMIPMSLNVNGTSALLWSLNCKWTLRYNAKREYTEQVSINVQANVQATVTSPTIEQHTEVLKVSLANVGLPLLSINAWSNYRNQSVEVATMILPNDRAAVGGTSYQICVTPGVAGSVEPQFSDVPGTVTIDGTVHWASLGEQPPSNQPAWSDSTPVPVGEIVLYEPKIWNDASGSFQNTGQSCYLLCVTPGTTNSTWVDFTYLPTATSNDDTLPPAITTSYIPGPAQTSPYVAPITTKGALVTDGTVHWLSLGSDPGFLGIPLGGTTENVTARSYFTTDRGHWTIEYLICKARARLRVRARCVKIQWDAPFEDCLDLSLRKNATLLDGRLPGGAATGKIMSYALVGSRDGKLIGHIEIGSAVGYGNSVPDVTGVPEYTAATGYMQAGYQLYDGGQSSIADGDIAYTPPAFRPFDDGLAFPLQSFPGIIKISTPDQVKAVEDAIVKQTAQLLRASQIPFSGDPTKGTASFLENRTIGGFLAEGNPVEYALSATPVTAEIIIRPTTNGPFAGNIVVECSTLEIQQGINLSAGSS